MRQSFYREVKKCEKNMKSLKKNPNSTKEFIYKMPPFKNNDLVHKEGKCKCIVEADKHELSAIGGLAMADLSLLDSSGLDSLGKNAEELDLAVQGEAGQVIVAQSLPRHQHDHPGSGNVHYLHLYSNHQEEHQRLYRHHSGE